MFSSLDHFGKVACPSKSECQLPNCLFSHSSVTREVSTSAKTPVNATQDEGPGPRKRRKVDNGSDESGSIGAAAPSLKKTGLKPGSDVKPTRSPNPSKEVPPEGKGNISSTFSRPISPPPRRLRTSLSEKNAPTGSLSSCQAGSLPVPTPIESLNPRHLLRPPASHAFRLKAVTLLHNELVRLNNLSISRPPATTFTPQELISMALSEEERVAISDPLVYSNIIKHRISAFKKMSLCAWLVHIAPAVPKEVTSKPAALRRGPPEIDTGLTPSEEVHVLSQLVTPSYTSQLSPANGFVTTIPTSAEILTAQEGVNASLHTENCDRCGTRFRVFPGRRESDGALTSGGKCTYHWGKTIFPQKISGQTVPKGSSVEKVYTCCQETIGQSPGCVASDTHVFKVTDGKRLGSIMQFANTPDPRPLGEIEGAEIKKAEEAVAIDCEMCYTTSALSLVRLTATSFPSRRCVLDVLVRPQGEVLDLNSRFSGVYAEDLAEAIPWDMDEGVPPEAREEATAGVEGKDSDSNERQGNAFHILPSPEAARSVLFRLIDSSTYLIGHGLENDLTALRVVHPPERIIDTALLFRHRRGLPFRYGLKMLVSKYLERDIQVAEVAVEGKGRVKGGHDSKEDARAAGDLVRWKVREVWKKLRGQGWTWTKKGEVWVLKGPKTKGRIKEDTKGSGKTEGEGPLMEKALPELGS